MIFATADEYVASGPDLDTAYADLLDRIGENNDRTIPALSNVRFYEGTLISVELRKVEVLVKA